MELFEEDYRIARIFGKGKGESPPDATVENFKFYFNHPDKNLSFPFEAEYFIVGAPIATPDFDIKVTGLFPLEDSPHPFAEGILCEGKKARNGRTVQIPLWTISPKEEGENKQLIRDCSYWWSDYSV